MSLETRPRPSRTLSLTISRQAVLPLQAVSYGLHSLTCLHVQTKDITSIARHLAVLPKKNSARPRTVIITQGTDPTIVAVSKDGGEPEVKEVKVHTIAASEINDTNGAG